MTSVSFHSACLNFSYRNGVNQTIVSWNVWCRRCGKVRMSRVFEPLNGNEYCFIVSTAFQRGYLYQIKAVKLLASEQIA